MNASRLTLSEQTTLIRLVFRNIPSFSRRTFPIVSPQEGFGAMPKIK